MIEWLEDLIEENPNEALPQATLDSAAFHTGDPVVDSWEKKLRDGKPIDVLESFSPSDRAIIEKKLAQQRAKAGLPEPPKVEVPPDDEFHDTYTEDVNDAR